MPDTKISADSAATTTAGAEVAGIQGGGNVRIPAGLLQQSVRTGTVTATAHGFVAGDVLKLSGTTWSKAIATSVANATAIAVVESATTDTFVPVLAGRITLSGLTAGIYYLSDATAGLLTLTAPTTTSSYLVPVLRAVSATDAYVDIGSPLTLSAIASTDISDFNSATRAQVEAELVAGTNVTLTPSGTGASRQITIAATGGGGGSGDVTAAAVIADNAIVRGDGGSKGVQGSAPTITDAGDIQVSGDGVQGSLRLADAHATAPKFWTVTTPASMTDQYGWVIPAAIPTVGQSIRVASVAGEVVTLENYTPSGSGTVTKVSVVTANGVSGSVATDTTTPAISITLGAITPTSVNGVTVSGSSTPTLAVTGTTAVSGTNTGDNAANSLYSGLISNATHTGDATGSTALTLATVNSNVGSFTNASITVNAKGLITAASSGGSGTKTYAVFTALDAMPPATNFATFDTRNSVPVLDFDGGSTNEETTFIGVIPEGASLGSGLKVRIHWMATSATSGNCRWGVCFEKTGTDLDSDSYDTAVEAHTACSGTSGIEVVTELTVTTIDSITAGDRYRLKVYRDASDTTNDTIASDCELVSVEVRSAA